MRRLVALLLIVIISVGAFSFLLNQNTLSEGAGTEPFHVGVTFQGDTVAEAKLLIDRVKSYTNLFVLGNTLVSRDESATNEVCDYAITQGLDIMINFGYYNRNPATPEELFRRWPWQHSWINAAKQKYGTRFLGVYYDDEPGGTQLDYNWPDFFANYSHYFSSPLNTTLHQIYARLTEANASGVKTDNYDLDTAYFVNGIRRSIGGRADSGEAWVTTLTSDYALYWFDYLGGYDVILAQIGWNHSTVQDIALVKGAARLQNKSWGTIITWKYNSTPYLDSGMEIYRQMVASYRAGASYIMVFNYPELEGNPYGVMQDEHFLALEEFWRNFVSPNPRFPDLTMAEAALVLPRNYGWGMRKPDDRIWGIWGPDDKSPQIWEISRRLISKYGLLLDIVYDDPAFPVSGKYNRIYYWNDTVQSKPV